MLNRTRNTAALLFVVGVTNATFADNNNPTLHDAVQAGLAAASPTKIFVVEEFNRTGRWPSTNTQITIPATSSGVTAVRLGADGVITIEFNSPLELSGQSIIITPEAVKGGVIFSCKASRDFPREVLPKPCQ